MKSPFLYSLFICLTFLCTSVALGQEKSSQEHVVQLSDWPLSAYDKAATDSLLRSSEIVPLIDALTISYTYGVVDQEPTFNYKLQWKPGAHVYIDGEEIVFDELSGEVLIESIVLQAEVVVDGSPVTLLTLAHDSLMSSMYPGLVSVDLGSLSWATFFADTNGNTAKSYFLEGFELANLKISEISFVYFEGDVVAADDPAVKRPRQPSRRTIYRPGISIWIDFPFYGRRPPPRVAGVDTRATQPRGDRVGRGDRRDEGERSSSDRRDRDRAEEDDDNEGNIAEEILGGRKKKEDDDDEEDEGELMSGALAGVIAVAAVAVIGGTVGYYGNVEHAPIGLMTGYVSPKGGGLLQVAVNEALLEKSRTETEHLVARITGFYDVFNAPIQPAVGFGVLVSQQNNEVDYEPSISLGLAGNFGSLVLLSGYDVLAGGLDVGIAYNFRARR
ncbi:MAG: hypothetical protein AB8G77_08575 [Rhodothermales bacterium]